MDSTIINFVNTSIVHHVENYPVDNDDFYRINEIELEIEGIKNKQYISNSLWQCYRGSGSPVIPTLLKIIHMALEKFLLKECENNNFDDVEIILKEILLKSKSASLTAVVTSIVLTYPDNFFDIALVLFNTLDLFIYDTIRWTQESEAKFLCTNAPFNTQFLVQERLDACNQKFRKTHLEGLIITYQYIRRENISEDIFKDRLESIQKLIDNNLEELNSKNLAQEDILRYRKVLSRIDRRNLKPIKQETDEGFQISFENVNEDKDLKEDSENSFKEVNDIFKYVDLSNWADAKINNEPILEMRDVKFSYESGKEILHGVSFKINKGEMVSIVGRNGAGKSTISKLICGFYKPTEGQILFDGRDLINDTIIFQTYH